MFKTNLSEILNEVLTIIDIFGYPLTFKHNQAINYRTKLGGSFTFMVVCFLIYAFLHISRDCFHKTNPIVRENSFYDDKAIVFGDKFFFSLFFTDDKYNILSDPEKYLVFHGVISNYTDDLQVTTVPFVKCDFDKHFNKTKVNTEKIAEKMKNFEQTYCLDIDDKFFLMNSGTEIPRLSLSIFVIECANKTIDGVDCNNLFLLNFLIL